MDTIEIILAVAIFLVLLFAWDNSGRIDQLQRRIVAKESGEKRGTDKNLLGIIEEMEKEIEAKTDEIKSLKAELNKCKFDYACEVAGGKTEELKAAKCKNCESLKITLAKTRRALTLGAKKVEGLKQQVIYREGTIEQLHDVVDKVFRDINLPNPYARRK